MGEIARSNVLAGVAAGAVGTAALELVAPLERRIAGGPLPFRPSAIADGLGRLVGLRVSARGQARLGRLLRWSYGPGWGALYGALRERLPRRRSARAATLAGAILALELVALPPLVGRRLLRPRSLAALGVHVALFAVCVEGVLGRGALG